MRCHRPFLRLFALAGALAAIAPAARADTLGTRAQQRGVITHIDKGVFQLGVTYSY
jgi:hypothetical protein